VDGLFLRGILREIAPRVTGARVRNVSATSDGVLVLRLTGRDDALCVAATSPLRTAFLAASSKIPSLGTPDREPAFARNLRSSEIVGLEAADWRPRLEILFRHVDTVGLSSERRVLAELGSRPRLTAAPRSRGSSDESAAPTAIEPDRLSAELLVEWLGDDRTLPRLLNAVDERVAGGPARTIRDIVTALAERSEGTVHGAPLLSDDLLTAIPDALTQVANGKGPLVRPTVLFRRDTSGRLHVRLTPVAVPFAEGAGRSFKSFNEAAGFAFTEFRPVFELERHRLDVTKSLDRMIRRKKRAIRKVEAEIDDGECAAEHRRRGDLLLAHQSEVPRGGARVTLEDFDGSSRIDIELDPRLGPVGNAERFFRAARKAARRAERAPRRLEQLEEELRELLSQRDAATEASGEELSRAAVRHAPLPHRKRDRRTESRARFRSYTISGDWEVLVGKSNRDNDMLTHRIAHPNDLWFHARQVAGSHVVLRRAGRKSEPDARAIREAAAIAAFHSKAGKSGKTAVCYTERRHVRKPRGAKPGLAEVKHEKVVMVYPALPKDESP